MPNFATTHEKSPPRIAHTNEFSVAEKYRAAAEKMAVAAAAHQHFSTKDSMSSTARERARRIELAAYLIADQCGFAKGIVQYETV